MMILSSEKNRSFRLDCMILLIKLVKVGNGKERARQVKGRGITAVVSKRVKLIAAEGCLQDMRYLNR